MNLAQSGFDKKMKLIFDVQVSDKQELNLEEYILYSLPCTIKRILYATYKIYYSGIKCAQKPV